MNRRSTAFALARLGYWGFDASHPAVSAGAEYLFRQQQDKLFDYLLTNHPKDFTFLVQSCEDRTGHWLYPIAPYNAGYNEKINNVRLNAFPSQYIAMDKVLGTILKHTDENTYVFMISDHGIKPLREAIAALPVGPWQPAQAGTLPSTLPAR